MHVILQRQNTLEGVCWIEHRIYKTDIVSLSCFIVPFEKYLPHGQKKVLACLKQIQIANNVYEIEKDRKTEYINI